MKSPVSLYLVLAIAGGSLLSRTAAAQPAPAPAGPGSGEPIPLVEIYGTVVPFLEYGHTTSASPTLTPTNIMPADRASQVATYSGVNLPARGIMDPSTTNIGFRGGIELMPNLSAVWQVESAVPIDGTGPANTWASRNTNLGLTGTWGTLFYGNWDTPYSWITKSTVNPIKSGNITDYNAILDNPGFGVSSVTTQSTRAGNATAAAGPDAAFERRQGNQVQYWTPNISGFVARAMVSVDEGRTTPTATVASTRPLMLSAAAAFDKGGLKLRAAVEGHWDYFGMSVQGGSQGPTATNSASTDFGTKLVAQYTIPTPGLETRILGMFEFLSYKNNDTTAGANTAHARPAVYGMVEQSFGKHHIWVGGGKAFEGSCEKNAPAMGTAIECNTKGLSATDLVFGYLYRFSKSFDLWAAAYRISNDFAASYTSSPTIGATAPGVMVEAFGIGFIYTFSAKIIGPPPKAAAAPPPAPAPAPATPVPASTNEPGPVPSPAAPTPAVNPETPAPANPPKP
jgi:predicted porin